MEHHDVVTLFHEFGHLVHHVLAGAQRWARFSGVATEWDFVEAPSQMLEEWAWDADVLQGFALDADGKPIPRRLVQRMREAEEFGKGYLVRTQMFYAALSYLLHRDRPADLTAAVRETQRSYDMFAYIDGTHSRRRSGTWPATPRRTTRTCGAWSSRRTCSRRSTPTDLLAPAVARRYRDSVLARAGQPMPPTWSRRSSGGRTRSSRSSAGLPPRRAPVADQSKRSSVRSSTAS